MRKPVKEYRTIYMVRVNHGGWVYGTGDYTGPLEFESAIEAESYMRCDQKNYRVVRVRVTIEEIEG